MTDRFVITETCGVQEVHALAGSGDYDTLCGYDPTGLDNVSRLIGTSERGKINCMGCADIVRAARNYTLRDIAGSVVSGL